jgi:uncharacterized LabA/DUF88 family protein
MKREHLKSEFHSKANRLAVLIDAENAKAHLIEPLLKEIAKHGTAQVKRIYGDWTTTRLNSWKNKLNKFAIQPIQQFGYTTGKNSTDSALIIDAMDLLYTQNFEGFCLVSSDSDFTRLATRIRESGLVVYGFGEKKTPEAFVAACDKFIYTEILEAPEAQEAQRDNQGTANSALEESKPLTSFLETSKDFGVVEPLNRNKELVNLLIDAYEAIAGEDGWANLGPLGAQLTKLSPSFDSRNYKYKKLGELVRAVGMFEIKETPHEKSPGVKDLQIKLKLEH